ncbi:MAG: hypothetical protein HKO07_01670, partial [Pseudomonadales bacterium]|nr:hypothetical protein [Pseudomonadales bacterium]
SSTSNAMGSDASNASGTNRRRSSLGRFVCLAMSAALLIVAPQVLAHGVHHAEQPTRQLESPDETPAKARDQETIAELIQRYSLEGDDHLIEKARQILDQQPARLTSDSQTKLHRAWLAQAEHQFASALALADEVLSTQPGHPQGLLMRAAILTVLGDPRATAACHSLVAALDLTAGLACQAQLLDGELDQTLAMQKLITISGLQSSNELSPWVDSVIADLARTSGHYAIAERYYRRSSAAFPSVQVRSAHVDLMLLQQQYSRVLAYVDPTETAPALAVRRMVAGINAGVTRPKDLTETDQQFRRWVAREDFKHAREMAMFYLDVKPDLELAHQLASINLQTQREREDRALLERTNRLLGDKEQNSLVGLNY